MNRTPALKPYLLITVFITTLIYSLGLFGAFVYDDYQQIVTNTRLHNIFNFYDVIFCELRQNRVWQNISIALNWTISPGETWSFKTFNLILHLINSSLLFLWLKKLFADKPSLPILTTSLFLIHPLQIQSVTYAMGVIMLFHGFFTLSALYWYSKYSLTRLPVLILILTASLFARETCILIPLILLFYELLINKSRFNSLPKKKWAILFLIPLLYFPLNAFLQDPNKTMYAGTAGLNLYPFWEHLASQLYYQSFYLVLFFNPSFQSIFHAPPSFNFIQMIGASVGALIWIGGLVFVFFKNQKLPRVTFLVLFFFLNYLPTNSLIQFINPFAEYRLYLSNLSLCLLLAFAIDMFLKRFKTLPMIVIALFAMFTYKNVMIWRDWKYISAQAIKQYPDHNFTGIGLGKEHLSVAWFHYQSGDHEKALKIIENIEKNTGKHPLPATLIQLKTALEQQKH